MGTPRGLAVAGRVARLLATPSRAWALIAAEPADVRGLFPRYVAPLAAIPAICSVAGPLRFGFNIANVAVVMSPLGLFLGALAGYGLTFVTLLAAAYWVDLMSGLFGGARDRGRSLELVTYAATATWIAGLAELYPSAGLAVAILAWVYSLYTLYLGMTPMLGAPPERRLTAFAAMMAGVVTLWALRGWAMSAASALGGPLSAYTAPR